MTHLKIKTDRQIEIENSTQILKFYASKIDLCELDNAWAKIRFCKFVSLEVGRISYFCCILQ